MSMQAIIWKMIRFTKLPQFYLSAALLIICTLIFFTGVAVGYKGYPPTNLLLKVYMHSKTNELYEQLPSQDQYAKSEELFNIETVEDIEKKRNELFKYIWGKEQQEIPTDLKFNVKKGFMDDNYSDFQNLKQINKVTVEMELGINSVIYHFEATHSNNELIIYHQGHSGDFYHGKESIRKFLEEGYSVVALSMPLLGKNSQPYVNSPIHGDIKLTDHNKFYFIELEQGSPVKFFIEPISASLQYAESFSYSTYHMVGLSGGGWSTVLYAALEPRIGKSFPVAGSLPFFLREEHESGDYEQKLYGLYKIANYLDLYLMGSYGHDRKQLQIFNKFDSCCFFGTRALAYEKTIINKLTEFNEGRFKIVIDDTHDQHMISEHALNIIIDSLQSAKSKE